MAWVSTGDSRKRVIPGVLLLAGCVSPLPVYPWKGEVQALAILAARAEAISTVTASGTITMTRPDGEGVTLDIALAIDGGDCLRLRAWKFGNPVLDLTSVSGETWIWSAETDSDRSPVILSDQALSRMLDAWSLLSGRTAARGTPLETPRTMLFVVRCETVWGQDVLAEIDRETVTVRAYRLFDASGCAIRSLTMDDYMLSDRVPWPMRIAASGPDGSIVIRLDSVELNAPLMPSAFIPPARARRILRAGGP